MKRDKILVVDDEEWNVACLIQKLKQDSAFEVEYLNTPSLLLEDIFNDDNDTNYLAIISDLNMAPINGLQLFQLLRGRLRPALNLNSNGINSKKDINNAKHRYISSLVKENPFYDVEVFCTLQDCGINTLRQYQSIVDKVKDTELVLYSGSAGSRIVDELPEDVTIFLKSTIGHGSDLVVLDYLIRQGYVNPNVSIDYNVTSSYEDFLDESEQEDDEYIKTDLTRAGLIGDESLLPYVPDDGLDDGFIEYGV